MRLVAVTGASGFLGQRLVPILLAEGFAVRALYRRPSAPEGLARLEEGRLELLRADLLEPAARDAALRGADAVVHAAALARDWGSAAEFRRENVDMTRGLLDSARKAGARQFIFLSSVSVQGFGRHEGSTEAGPYYRLGHPYQKSKYEAERLVLEANSARFSAASLRLGYVYGPGDTTSTYRMFDAARAGRFGYIGSGEWNTSLVYVDDACQAIAQAVGNAELGGKAVNIVGDEHVAWRDFAQEVYEAAGARGRPRRLPRALTFAAAAFMEAAWRLAGSRDGPPLTLYRVRRSTVEYTFSNALAKKLLDFSPDTPVAEGLRAAATAYFAGRGESKPARGRKKD